MEYKSIDMIWDQAGDTFNAQMFAIMMDCLMTRKYVSDF